jgi:FAD/FMN-containing dehydrogenase/Fe-S oxidoreductase
MNPDLLHALQRAQIPVRADLATRYLYSTDASIYQIEPLGVAFPRHADDLAACVELAAAHDTPVLARGAGSSLAGQAVGRALILDCSRRLTTIHAIRAEHENGAVVGGEVTLDPGVVLAALNKAAARHGLQFGPDPASAERATLGGSIANNASGAHSILYGMAADHIISADVVLADGSLATFDEVSGERLTALNEPWRRDSHALLAAIYRFAGEVRARHAETIRARWPRVWRSASGYNLHYLLPWSPSQPPQWASWMHTASSAGASFPYPLLSASSLNLAPLLAGSEGTLAVIRRLTLRLVPLPAHTILAVLPFPSVAEACDAAPALLERQPSAVELIPQALIQLARSVPAYARQLSFLDPLAATGGEPPALLVVEFSGGDPARLRQQALALREVGAGEPLLAETAAAQKQVWAVRKVGLGLLMSRPGDAKPVAFIEDVSVPVERLGEFVREMARILAAHGTTGDFYAHASAGCLHLRPWLNLKTEAGMADLRAIASATVALVSHLGGAMTGEHGDGLARSEWLEQIYGREIVGLFQDLKRTADPQGILNPGKLVDAPPMDANLRFGGGYHSTGWQPTLNFDRQAGLLGAIEQCNGAGVCRKADGVMCPSFQATQDEMHSTRGRSNLLRALISQPAPERFSEPVYEALDLCLACKGCKAECPSGVDVAKLRYEFMHHYYRTHRRKLRDYLFGYIGALAPLAAPFGPLVNILMRQPALRRLAERLFGLAARRPFPHFRSVPAASRQSLLAPLSPLPTPVLLLRDTFNHHFYPETEVAALSVLEAAGCAVLPLPVFGAGRTLISKGFLEAARKHAARLVEAVARLDPEGKLPIVGLEPSEIYTLKDEYLDLLPGDARLTALASRAWMLEEFLLRPDPGGQPFLNRLSVRGAKSATVLLHGHCYQKAQPPAADGFPVGVAATVAALKSIGYSAEVIDDGCCGMAGAFGYEAEHYNLSMQVGELALFPALRAAAQSEKSDIIIVAPGVSCQAQIEDGVGLAAIHPICLIASAIFQS